LAPAALEEHRPVDLKTLAKELEENGKASQAARNKDK
jgi:hypothetical protein